MSTRANIVVKDEYGGKLWFYRHSDGYPEGALPMLDRFVEHVNSGAIRNNVGQAAGWLIIFGHDEYDTAHKPGTANGYGWKCGAIEPTTAQHDDIEYLYTIDLATTPVIVEVSELTDWETKKFKPIEPVRA